MKKVMYHIFSMSFLVEVVLIIFAIASASTISDYSIKSHMNIITSYSIGIGMGTILVIMAILLSRIEEKASEFKVLFVATILVAVLSGILQSLAYIEITGNIITSVVKGLGFPIVEVALAYAVSKYITYTKKKELENADEKLNEQLTRMQHEATVDMDPEIIRAEVEDDMKKIMKAKINKFTNDQLKKYGVVDDEQNLSILDKTEIEQLRAQLEYVRTENVQSKDEHVRLNAQIENAQIENAQLEQMIINLSEQIEQLKSEQPSVQMGNEQKVSIKNVQTNEQKMSKEEKMNMLIAHLIEHYDGVQTDELKPTKLAQELPIDRTTVSRYIEQLKIEQKLNGHVNAQLLR